jgi:hypothetical protein
MSLVDHLPEEQEFSTIIEVFLMHYLIPTNPILCPTDF